MLNFKYYVTLGSEVTTRKRPLFC